MVARRKAALVGCGRMGAFTSPAVLRDAPACWFPLAHADAIARHPGLVLSGLADSSREAAERAARAHGSPPVFATVDGLLQAVRPELLCIATRTPERAAIILQAVASGVRALHVEKPLCSSMAELVALESRLAAGDICLTWGAIRRWMQPYRAALAYAESGQLGALTEVQIQFGEAPLCWSHPHSIDLLLFAAGDRALVDVAAVLGTVETGRHPHDVRNDPIVHSVTLRFDDGLIGRITRVPADTVVLAGPNGAISVEADGHRLRRLAAGPQAAYPAWEAWPIPEAAAPAGTLAALAQLVDCLDGKVEAIAKNARIRKDILLSQRVIFAILQSHAQGGAPVQPDAVANDWQIAAITAGNPA